MASTDSYIKSTCFFTHTYSYTILTCMWVCKYVISLFLKCKIQFFSVLTFLHRIHINKHIVPSTVNDWSIYYLFAFKPQTNSTRFNCDAVFLRKTRKKKPLNHTEFEKTLWKYTHITCGITRANKKSVSYLYTHMWVWISCNSPHSSDLKRWQREQCNNSGYYSRFQASNCTQFAHNDFRSLLANITTRLRWIKIWIADWTQHTCHSAWCLLLLLLLLLATVPLALRAQATIHTIRSVIRPRSIL